MITFITKNEHEEYSQPDLPCIERQIAGRAGLQPDNIIRDNA